MNNCGQCPRILLVDSYDSFTFNIASLIIQAIPSAKVHIIRNDQFNISKLLSYLPYISAIVVGPGPGSPLNANDIGLINDLWSISKSHLLPVFGICLGLQSLAVSYGATLQRLKTVKHGIRSSIQHVEDDLFEGVTVANVVRYHSLHVDITTSSEIRELAWANDGQDNGRVTMAIRHESKPFWAVQYHPESALSDNSGLKILQNFWKLATRWSVEANRVPMSWIEEAQTGLGTPWPHIQNDCISSRITNSDCEAKPVNTMKFYDLPFETVPEICEKLEIYDDYSDFVLLDSAAAPGRYTIIGCIMPSSLRISYYNGDNVVYLDNHNPTTSIPLGSIDIWTWVAEFMRSKKYTGGTSDIPFWGGLIGYIGYEAGASCISQNWWDKMKTRRSKAPDICLIFIDRSIVIDLESKVTYLQSLMPEDEEWFGSVAQRLRQPAVPSAIRKESVTTNPSYRLHMPNKDEYIEKVNRAKEYLYAGESYELCLTARTRIQRHTMDKSSENSWDVYKKLRLSNPAPYAAFLKLGKVTLISSSPERFLSYTRPPNQVYRLEPIKGTVRKSAEITRERAQETLWNDKEMAENLMIVDLIRHDLHGVVGDNVNVRKFCSVEEYATVWQSVSVIEGALSSDEGDIGWYVLKSCLPPGSMTGAPKKRSVELLQTLEDDERGIYSGVVGYWSVCGGGDWSVIIRSCMKEERECKMDDTGAGTSGAGGWVDEWTVGAGGAITALSDAECEWEEMITKLISVIRAFNIASAECAI